MPTVMEAVKILEKTTGVAPATIRGVARQLIDDELLPKSHGRRIEQISTREFVLLMLASLCSKKVKDASRTAGAYFMLKIPDDDEKTKKHMRSLGLDADNITAGDWLDAAFRNFLEEFPKLRGKKKYDDKVSWILFGHVEIYTSHPEMRFQWERPDSGFDVFPLKFVPAGRSDFTKEDFMPSTLIKLPAPCLFSCAGLWRQCDESSTILAETPGIP